MKFIWNLDIEIIRNNTQFIAVRHVKAIKCLFRNIVIALSFNDRMLSLLSTVNGQRRDFKRKIHKSNKCIK